MRINYQRLHFGMLACVFGLTCVTLYMAFAFPYSLVHFKQADTSQLKAVLVVARHGEVSPPREAYFEALGEEPPEDWFALGGQGQLTAVGKERLYLLGKFLRLQYYERLLAGGNPRRLVARSADSDRCLESAEALVAGLLPPTTSASKGSSSQWLWSAISDTGDALAKLWQPKAIHTTREPDDDLLSSRTKCLELDTLRAGWKNSSRYAQLLNEFRHDLQVLRQNTGLAFEDDLEMASNLEEQLRARAVFVPFASSPASPTMPSWYTGTLASRLAHIADVTAGARFAHASSQRLFAGRLLDTITRNLFAKIRSDLSSGVSLLNDEPDSIETNNPLPTTGALSIIADNQKTINAIRAGGRRKDDNDDQKLTVASTKLLPPEEQVKLKLAHQREPVMFVYMTDKQHLSALMNSLGVYTSQPHYGAALVLELHFDPGNQIHFLRLFSINSLSHNVLPEPVRVQPLACLDSVECSPQQFEQNLRHLTLDRQSWQQACLMGGVQGEPPAQPITTAEQPPVVTARPSAIVPLLVSSTTASSLEFVVGPTERSDATSTSGAPAQTTTISHENDTTTTTTTTTGIDKLDASLNVGPTHTRPISSNDTTGTPTTIASSLIEIRTTTTVQPAPSETTKTIAFETTTISTTTTTSAGRKPSDVTSQSVTALERQSNWPRTTTTTGKSPEEINPPVETMTQMTPAPAPAPTTTTTTTTTSDGTDTSSSAPGGADSAIASLASRK